MNRVLRRSWLRSSGTLSVALPVFIALVGIGGFLLTAGATLPWLAFAWLFAIALIAFLVGTEIVLRRRAQREYAEIVTDRRRAEKDAQDMFEGSTDLLGSVGFDGRFKRINPAFVQTAGYSADELRSRPFTDFVHPDDVERTRQAFSGVLEGKEVIGFENRWVRPDGCVRWIEWNSRSDLDGQVIYSVGRDITESRRAQREFEEIFNVSPDLLCIIGFDGYFKRVNPAFEQAFGYSSKELLSRPMLEFGHPDDVAMSREEFERSTRGETITRFENRSIRADGTLLWLEWTARPLLDESIVYAAGRDITERKRREAELREARKNVDASRAELAVYAEEQAALRRVATMVGRGVSRDEVLDAVGEEVGRLLGAESTRLLRYEPDGTASILVIWGALPGDLPVGSRVTLEGENLAAAVKHSGRTERIDGYQGATGSLAAVARDLGIRSGVGAPIVVEGLLWGVIVAFWTRDAPPPVDAEGRIAAFTELVVTAIANAESRVAIGRLADEQAALRQVAVLVAQQPSPSEVFTAVTQAVGLLLDADLAVLHVFRGDGTATTIASWSGDGPMLPIGTRFPLDGDSLAARIFESGAPARLYSYDEAWERAETDLARSLRLRSAVGAPILVEGKLWGALMAATRGVEPWAENAETRIADFTGLAATAIANAESREALAELADEQAALRRVATLVAQEASPQDLFEAVAEEVGRLLRVGSATIGRFEPNDTVTNVASWSTTEAVAFPTGRRWPTEGTNVAWIVFQTGRTARIDDFSGATDPIGVAVREAGIKSAVGSPIVVKGHLWGVIAAASTEGPMPSDTEARLDSFTELVATAIANAESWSELAASRARVVAASAEERRRVVRDLHDGAQQRLVHTVINMKLALRELGRSDLHAEEHMSEALDHAEQANLELRELVYGILPGALTSGGLRGGVEQLASRSTLPVTFDVPAARLPTTIEATAYFVVSEALTNAVKHSQAQSAEVAAELDNGTLLVEVRDDGVGGADPSRGSGLTGLRDRVEALGGTIVISSPAGNGTSVTARLPAE